MKTYHWVVLGTVVVVVGGLLVYNHHLKTKDEKKSEASGRVTGVCVDGMHMVNFWPFGHHCVNNRATNDNAS